MTGVQLLTSVSLPMPDGQANNFWYDIQQSDTVVVFVHGVFSSSRSCWLFEDPVGHRHTFWPDLVRTDSRIGQVSIYLAGYHTSLEAGDYSLTECATELMSALQRTDVSRSRPVLEYELAPVPWTV